MIFVISAHARPDVRNFLTSGNGCFQSPTFPDHVTKKRRALGTRCGRAITSRMRTAEPLTAEVGAKQSIKRQLCTTHVGAFGWEPHSSSTTTWAGKVDHELKY